VGQGDRVLIVGASGNVGPFAVQIAKSRGAHVTGVARADKLDFARSLGAVEAIGYRTTDYTRPAEPYDWILGVDAHHPLRRWHSSMRPGGVYMAMGGSTAWMLSLLFWQPALKLTTLEALRARRRRGTQPPRNVRRDQAGDRPPVSARPSGRGPPLRRRWPRLRQGARPALGLAHVCLDQPRERLELAAEAALVRARGEDARPQSRHQPVRQKRSTAS
jgi:hypothetical protein